MLRMTAPASGSDKCELPVNGKVDWQFALIQGAIVYKRLLPRLEGLSPLMLVPGWPATGAMPARAARWTARWAALLKLAMSPPMPSGMLLAVLTPVPGDCGILCMSDTIAIGALRELTEHGIRVPDDVRLMGFDGIPFSACANPPISTVAMDVPAMARTVINRMVTLIESNLRHERPDDITHDHIQFQVMPRTSTLAA